MKRLSKTVWLLSAALFIAVWFTGCSAETRKQRHAERADRYFKAGDFAKAEVEYLNVLKLDRNNAPAIRQLGLMYEENGRTLRAYPFLAKTIEFNPNDTEVRMKLAFIQLALGAVREGRTNAMHVLEKDPKNPLAPLLLAETTRTPQELRDLRLQLEAVEKQTGGSAGAALAFATLFARENKLNEAEVQIKKALSMDPKFPAAHHLAGILAWTRGDRTNAAQQLKAAAEFSPLRSTRRVQYAEFLLKTGQREEGKAVLFDLTQKAPEYLLPWLALAEVALAERDLTNCAKYVSRAWNADPENPGTQLLGARLHLAEGEIDKAIGVLDRLTSRYEKLAPAYYYLAVAYSLKNDTGKALQNVNRAVTLNPALDDAVLFQAQLNVRRENPDAAISSLTPLINRQPHLVQARLMLINAYLVKRDYENAIDQCAKIRTQFPTNAQVPLITGNIFRQQGRAKEARAQYEHALELAPDFLPALEQLVDLEVSTGNPESAVARVRAVIDRAGESQMLQTLLAKALIGQKQENEAERALLRAIEMDPNFHVAYMVLAKLYIDSGQKDKALEKLQETLARNPKDVASLMMLGSLQFERQEFSAARDTYNRLLAINPNYTPALNNLADIYSEHLNDLEKAYETARKARDLWPRDAHVADTLGWILYKRGEYSWALGLLQESAERLSAEPLVLFHLGMTHYMLGNEEKAENALQRALDIGKDFSGKAEATSRLAFLKTVFRNTPDSIATLEQMIDKNPNDPVVLSRLAALYVEANQLNEAVALYERAVKSNPKNLPATIRLAQIYAGPLHDSRKAMQYAKAGRNLAPEDPEIAHTLGRLAYASGDFSWAVGLLQESQRKLSRDPGVLHDLALAQLSVGRIQEAESTMEAALESDPISPQASSAQRFLQFVKASFVPATALAVQAEAQLILRTNATDLSAQLVQAVAQEHQGETAAARQTYQSIIERFPLFALAHKRLAILHSLPGGDANKAYEHAVRARSAFPQDHEVARVLGILSYNRKDYDRAVQLLKQSAAKWPNDAEILAYLGLSQHELKQKADAERNLRRALAGNLNPGLAEQANRVLSIRN